MKIWQFILDRLKKKEPVALLTVAATQGSTPGKVGFFMAIDKHKNLVGTIGGGIMEVNLCNQAHYRLCSGDHLPQLIVQTHQKKGPKAQQSGMICAGTQLILSHVFQPEDENKLKTLMGNQLQTLSLSSTRIEIHAGKRPTHWQPGENWSFEQTIGGNPTVFVVGSGHVGLALCRTLQPLIFQTIAFDHRSELDTVKANHFADRLIVEDYQKLGDYILNPDMTFIVVVTTGFESDVAALACALKTKARFIGLMGSAAKIQHIQKKLLEMGFSQSDLNRIHAPIGINIANETPEEIAISIAAQLIHNYRSNS